jgi:hypothetical protein
MSGPTFAYVYKRASAVFVGTICLSANAWRVDNTERLDWELWIASQQRRIKANTLAGLLAQIEAETLLVPSFGVQLESVASAISGGL